jgi:hypothetical protein
MRQIDLIPFDVGVARQVIDVAQPRLLAQRLDLVFEVPLRNLHRHVAVAAFAVAVG